MIQILLRCQVFWIYMYKLLYFKVQQIKMAYSGDCIATQHKPLEAMAKTSNGITAKGLGIATDKPKFSQYAQIAKRYESFQNPSNARWPASCPVAINDLVEAGLVYTGEQLIHTNSYILNSFNWKITIVYVIPMKHSEVWNNFHNIQLT